MVAASPAGSETVGPVAPLPAQDGGPSDPPGCSCGEDRILCRTPPDVVDRTVRQGGAPEEYIKAIAQAAGLAVLIVGRGDVDEHLGTAMTDDRWWHLSESPRGPMTWDRT